VRGELGNHCDRLLRIGLLATAPFTAFVASKLRIAFPPPIFSPVVTHHPAHTEWHPPHPRPLPRHVAFACSEVFFPPPPSEAGGEGAARDRYGKDTQRIPMSRRKRT